MPTDVPTVSTVPTVQPLASAADAPQGAAPGARTLQEACRALWLATLSLMTAYLHNRAPAHRLLLARRIARNFATLADQPCYDAAARARFARLQARWDGTARRLAGEPARAADPLAAAAAQLAGWWRRLCRAALPLRH